MNSFPCAFNHGNSTVVPSNHIHITLIKLKLQSNILDDRMAAKVLNLIKLITNKNIYPFPLEFYTIIME